MTPFFSIVIPCYNRPLNLKKALESCLSQTFKNFEVIVVDDGSQEDIKSVVEEFNSSKIYYHKQENSGASVARNRGIDLARGEYIAFLDSDDLYRKDKLDVFFRKIQEVSQSCSSLVLYSKISVLREGGKCWTKPNRGVKKSEEISEYLMVHHQFIQTSTIVVPSKLAKKNKFTEGLIFGQDTDFCIKLGKSGADFIFIDKELTIWFDEYSPSRVSSTNSSDKVLLWLDGIRNDITDRAYYCYKGFHIARMLSRTNKARGIGLYLQTLFKLYFPPKLAVIAFLQVVLPAKLYRECSNLVVRILGVDK
jgi:glycosyltransferase involved in cell wall biosynthesis